MSVDDRLRVVLCWHMHQPIYKDLVNGEYRLPWTYLHAIKDYVDMAAHIEAVDGAKAVVNFAPVLLEQLEDYARQVDGFLNHSQAIHDPVLAALDMAALPADPEHRIMLIKACLRANEDRVIGRFPAYGELAEMARWYLARPETHIYIADQFLADLVVWYHLGWMAETVRRVDDRVQALMDQGRGYRLKDRRTLLTLINELLWSIIPRYRALAEQGKVELAMSPYAHPIAPLLLDLQSAREAWPDAPMPAAQAYPGGEARSRYHLEEGRALFQRLFGIEPTGCWPSEGSISDATLAQLDAMGFRWAASGESVLRNSLARAESAQHHDTGYQQPLNRPYRLAGGKLASFFRDDGLSDLIGFTYGEWHADDAVANLVHHLENIDESGRQDGPRSVSIILDGENAWEYYPKNGYYFLGALYRKLAEHPRIKLTTFSEVLDEGVVEPGTLPGVVAGSWVYGTFSTWIGEPEKNRAWDMLVEAKEAFDRVVAEGRLGGDELAAAERQLALCEGSDWFWWFGDYNPAETVSDFEYLYRLHLSNLYQLLGVEPPEYLSHTFTRGQGAPVRGGVMRRGQMDN